jgi:hypothetical protein
MKLENPIVKSRYIPNCSVLQESAFKEVVFFVAICRDHFLTGSSNQIAQRTERCGRIMNKVNGRPGPDCLGWHIHYKLRPPPDALKKRSHMIACYKVTNAD